MRQTFRVVLSKISIDAMFLSVFFCSYAEPILDKEDNAWHFILSNILYAYHFFFLAFSCKLNVIFPYISDVKANIIKYHVHESKR